ncbi:MAG: trigger factor [Patescibacteria group bacterium]
MEVKITELSATEIEITGEIAWEEFEKYRPQALAHLKEHTELPGFRKGNVPENILREKLGPMKILDEMAGLALRATYPKIIAENKIEAIDRPRINVTKIAEGSPLGFKITQTVLPKIKLPDYHSIAKTISKEILDKNERRAKIIQAIMKEVKIPLPGIIAERQLEEMVRDIKNKYGSKESDVELRAHLRPIAEERVRVGLLIESIAIAENIEATKVLEFLESFV